jgi:ABC-2 type transport system ATP-binding protein
MERSPGIIKAQGLFKQYGDVTAVDNVSLSVGKGELFGLLGPNGSGKTTMIKMLTGQIRPTGGSATVLGLDVEKDPIGVRERVGIIPEQETPPNISILSERCAILRMWRRKPTGGLIFWIFPTSAMCSARIFPVAPGRN